MAKRPGAGHLDPRGSQNGLRRIREPRAQARARMGKGAGVLCTEGLAGWVGTVWAGGDRTVAPLKASKSQELSKS